MVRKDKNKQTIILVAAVFILVVLLFCFHIWQTYEETYLMVSPQITVSAATKAVERNKLPQVLLNDDEQKNLLNLNPFKISAKAPEPAPTSTKPIKRQARSATKNADQSHDLRLVGTISGGRGWAALLDTKLNIEGFYSPGSMVKEGIKLLAVTRSSATILFNGQEDVLQINWESNAPAASKSSTAKGRNIPGVREPSIMAAADGTSQSIELSSEDLKKNFKNLSHLLSQMRVQAYFEKGKPAGFLISKVRDNSFVAKLGAKKGDIIRSVNGDKVDSVQKAFKLYNSFKNNKSLDMLITRDGKPLTLKFSVK